MSGGKKEIQGSPLAPPVGYSAMESGSKAYTFTLGWKPKRTCTINTTELHANFLLSKRVQSVKWLSSCSPVTQGFRNRLLEFKYLTLAFCDQNSRGVI